MPTLRALLDAGARVTVVAPAASAGLEELADAGLLTWEQRPYRPSDVDGVWTDGSIVYLGEQREIKAFNVRDGLAVKLAQRVGLVVALITSRRSPALERRARELGITDSREGGVETAGHGRVRLKVRAIELPAAAPGRGSVRERRLLRQHVLRIEADRVAHLRARGHRERAPIRPLV